MVQTDTDTTADNVRPFPVTTPEPQPRGKARSKDRTGIARPPALAPGQAPQAGPLTEPRCQNQVSFPAALTASVIPPGTALTAARVRWARSCSSGADSQVTAPLPAPRATIRHVPFTDGRAARSPLTMRPQA